MSSYSRRDSFGLLALPLLAGCGFTPIYADGSAASSLNGKIEFAVVTNQMTFELREQLVRRLGYPAAPLYRLDIDLEVESEGLAITPDASITRFNLFATAAYSLRPITGGSPLLTGTVRSFTAYSANVSAYATLVAEGDALRRMAVNLADQIATRIAASAADLPA